MSKARTWELRQDDVKGKRCQLACKPGSVWLRREPERGSHSSGAVLAHRLAQPTRMTGLETGCRRLRAPRHPYSVLLPVGFTMPSLSPATRWALTPPFHPYPASSAARLGAGQQAGRYPFCGTFPGVAPAGRYPAPCFPGARTFLTSPPFGIGEARLPGQLAAPR